ncbi:MAG: PASTA domain-containing protein [Atopobiaceae bacterium]|nr:PASTA domain-containing protein [Atopobiaceae bacterium]
MAPSNDSSLDSTTNNAQAGTAAGQSHDDETILVSVVTGDTVVTTPPVDETLLYPLPSPSYDEEHGAGVTGQYGKDFSRLDHAYQDPRKEREIPIPHISDEDGSGYRVPGEGRSRSRWRPLLAFFLVGIMAVGIFAAATYGLEAWGGKSVPNVKGISEIRARTMLEEEGFTPEVKTRIADDGIGFVLEQEPESGRRIEEGSVVTIVVAVSRTMPDVMGLPQAEAQDLLSKAGAQTITIETRASGEPEGTVIAVDPGVGEAFSSYQTVTLTVASKAEVPDVVGKEKVEAQAAVEAAGFVAEITYTEGDGKANTVTKTEPAAGEKADPNSTVRLFVIEPMPTDPLHVLEYFGKQSPSIARYVTGKGFSLRTSFLSSDDEAEAVYYSDTYGNLCFCNRPYSHIYIHDDERNTGEDVLTNNHRFVGVRWEVPASMSAFEATEQGRDAVTRDLMSRCGLSNITDICTNVDVTGPSDLAKNNAKFRCTYGEVNGNAWTVLVINEEGGGTRAVVTCAPVSYYQQNYDLAPYGGAICDFVACADVYGER